MEPYPVDSDRGAERRGNAVLILAFPPGVLAYFAFVRIDDVLGANFFVASCAVLGVLGAAFFEWGVGLATDRENAAGVADRNVPGASVKGAIVRAGSAVLLGAISVALVLAVAVALAPAATAPAAALFPLALGAGGVTLGVIVAAGVLWLPAPAGAGWGTWIRTRVARSRAECTTAIRSPSSADPT